MAIKWFDKVSDVLVQGADAPGVNVFSVYNGPFALVHDALTDRKDVELVSCRIYKATVGTDDYVVPVLCRIDPATGNPAWAFYCGDQQVAGQYADDGKTLAAKLTADGKVSKKLIAGIDAAPWVGKVPDMGSCGFFKMQDRGRICSHTQAVLNQIQPAELDDMLVELKGWFEGEEADPIAETPMSEELAAMMRVAFLRPVLQVGDAGGGKTHTARQMVTMTHKLRPELPEPKFVEIQCHSSMESYEYRCYDRPFEGQIYSVLAGLAEVAYWTQQDIPVILHLDEYLNTHPSVQTALNSAIAIDGATNSYLVQTGEVEALPGATNKGRMKVVSIPRNLLWVIASSNIGPRFQKDKLDPSVRSRFRVVVVNNTIERMKDITRKVLGANGLPEELNENFGKFFEVVAQGVDENTLDETASTRLACDVIAAAVANAKRMKKRYSSAKQWLTELKQAMLDEMGQCVNFEMGYYDPDQETRFKALVDACFSKVAK